MDVDQDGAGAFQEPERIPLGPIDVWVSTAGNRLWVQMPRAEGRRLASLLHRLGFQRLVVPFPPGIRHPRMAFYVAWMGPWGARQTAHTVGQTMLAFRSVYWDGVSPRTADPRLRELTIPPVIAARVTER